MGKIARRTFLIGSAAIVGGVAFGAYKYKQPHDNPLLDNDFADAVAITPYVMINAEGVTIIAPRAEMGQGVHTTLAALVAEELDISWQDINVINGPASKAYYNAAVLQDGLPFAATDHGFMAETARDFIAIPAKFLAMQITGGSSTIPDGFDKMRRAGATARWALMQAAAERLDVVFESLKTQDGFVVSADGNKISYIDLAQDAANIDIDDAVITLKDSKDWRYLRQSMPRVDMVAKSTGKAEYAIDVQLPDMLYATVRMNPYFNGRYGTV